jgi:hypothetical protein
VSSDVAELATVRVEAWSFAERIVDGLFDRYAAAERAVQTEATAESDRRLALQGARMSLVGATERRPS